MRTLDGAHLGAPQFHDNFIEFDKLAKPLASVVQTRPDVRHVGRNQRQSILRNEPVPMARVQLATVENHSIARMMRIRLRIPHNVANRDLRADNPVLPIFPILRDSGRQTRNVGRIHETMHDNDGVVVATMVRLSLAVWSSASHDRTFS